MNSSPLEELTFTSLKEMNDSSFNSSSSNDTAECQSLPPLYLPDLLQIGLMIGYTSVGIASFIGNLIVILIVLLRKEMRTVTNVFISSVSAADLIITTCSLWATPLAYYHQAWNYGQVMCYLVYVVQGASLMWAPLTLAAIAIDRYMLVANPFKRQMTNATCLKVIAGIWFGAFFFLTPMLYHVDYMEINECNKYCIEYWQPIEYRMAYGLSILAIRSAAPLIVISWCHWRIACLLNSQSNKLQRHRSTTRSGDAEEQSDVARCSLLSCLPCCYLCQKGQKGLSSTTEIRRKQRLQTLLLAMVVIFAVSSVPLDLFNVLQDMELVYGIHLVAPNTKHTFFFISHYVAMAGTLLNPLVYAWWNENFRKQIKAIMAEFRFGRQQSLTLTTSLFERKAKFPKTSPTDEEQRIVLQVNGVNTTEDVHV